MVFWYPSNSAETGPNINLECEKRTYANENEHAHIACMRMYILALREQDHSFSRNVGGNVQAPKR